MTGRHGAVWYGNRRVGTLREGDDLLLRFAYDPEWLDQGGFPVSIRLPLSNGDREVEAHAYFEGLLPEGRVRQRICRQYGIDREDDAGLLLAIGEDCAGALSVLPEGVEPEAEPGAAESLTEGQIERLVQTRGAEPIATGQRQRFSLAGVQEKQPVTYDGQVYALPDRTNPSSHILKFETLPRVCFAEYIASEMARHLELPVVKMEFLRTAGSESVPYLRIERYDRQRDTAGHLRRLHQEDLLQALGLPTVLKYQGDGGPSLKDVADILRDHTGRPIDALERLRDWQIFNYLVGNWDGHAKNLALLYQPGHSVPDLAPFYDLVAIEFFNLIRPGTWSRDMALLIGEHNVPERVTRTDWEAFARDLGMPTRRVLSRLEELAHWLPELAEGARRAFAGQFGDEPAYDYLEESVWRRCRWILNSA